MALNFNDFKLNKILIILGSVAGVLIVIFFVWFNSKSILISGLSSGNNKPKSPISGVGCDNANRRPVAVMLSSDAEARPLSGIGEADLVVEMPVAPNGITRFMAVFQCQEPKEIGSIRSAREDFIPLAAGLDTIYAHWGGEADALGQLNSGIIDNVDALKYEGTTFYRKSGIPAPHNGFTTIANVLKKAKDLGYSLTKNFVGYPHSSDIVSKNLSNIANQVTINYPSPYEVSWTYDDYSNTYKRTRGGSPEIDKNTNQQVTASVVVDMHTKSKFLRDQYISVATTGQGTAEIYQNGVVVSGTWKKDPSKLESKLMFYDSNGNEISFVPGSIWIEVDTY